LHAAKHVKAAQAKLNAQQKIINPPEIRYSRFLQFSKNHPQTGNSYFSGRINYKD
jgi:hypothetical protein